MGYRRRRETFFRTNLVVLTDRDELAFSRVIREFCPDVMFMGVFAGDDGKRGYPLPSIPHDSDGRTSIMLPTPGQEDRWQLNIDMGRIMVSPWGQFYLERSKWEWMDPSKKWAFDLPLFGWGKLIVGFPRDDEEMKKYAGKLLRLVNKVTCKGGGYGLDACLWSQAGGKDERRGLGSGHCVDPSEEIKLNKYYDDALWEDRLPETPAWSRNIELPDDIRRV